MNLDQESIMAMVELASVQARLANLQIEFFAQNGDVPAWMDANIRAQKLEIRLERLCNGLDEYRILSQWYTA